MVAILSLALKTRLSGFGMQPLASVWQVLSRGTLMFSSLLPIHLMSHIVSGSYDKTIRVWNAATGQCVAGPFQGHTGYVTSVSYLPDGNHIISGSWGYSIKVWTTGELFSFGAFCEHNGWILSSNSVCYAWISPLSLLSFSLPVHSLVISSNNICQVLAVRDVWISCWK